MNPNEVAHTRKTALLNDLAKQIGLSEKRARRNNFIAFTLLLLAVTASGLAGILGLTEVLSAKWVGGIALLPPFLVLFERSLKFEGRSRWNRRKKYRLEDLRDQLVFQQPAEPTLDQIAAINKKIHKLNSDMQKEWDEELTLNWAGISVQTSHSLGGPGPPET